MLFLTAVCGQDYERARKMNMVDVVGLQRAFARVLDRIFGAFNIGETGLSKEEQIQRIFGSVPPPEEWIK